MIPMTRCVTDVQGATFVDKHSIICSTNDLSPDQWLLSSYSRSS